MAHTNQANPKSIFNGLNGFYCKMSYLMLMKPQAIYGQIKNALKMKGRPLPENDVWIAAIARQHKLPLVTQDAHFSHIDNLHIESW